MSSNINQAEWLSLIDVSGPFLSVPVLDKVFPQGLEVVEPATAARVRSAYEEWRESQDGTLHQAWIEFILAEVLEYESRVLKTNADIPATYRHAVPEHGVELRPSAILVEPSDTSKARLLIAEWPATQKDLQQAAAVDSWAAGPAERMTELCRATGVRLGLVTNGEQWVLVDAPQGETPAYVTWYASLWIEERVTLQAFRSLLGVRRFFASAADETLEQMLAASVQYQAEVTDQLGAQVRRAVEVLIQALDKADTDAGRKLLGEIPESVLYEASITVMMRLVFLFCAEERDLLLLGDPVYDQYYAVSTLRSILREEADQHGIEVLERRQDAWSRLLAVFRGIYGGIDHESLRLPACGGSLFDPDRFPFLEGRERGTTWQEDLANPLPVDNRTVLHLLEALQLLQMRGRGGAVEARRLSFRALDIEQIGHVYESLLDHTAVRAEVPTLGLVGKLGQEPEVSLPELEDKWMAGQDTLLDYLRDETRKSKAALQKLLVREVESEWGDQLRRECSDSELYQRVEPFHALVREDPWGDPIVMCPGDVYVTAGTDRRSSGTHYTPKALTEEIVRYTLEPLAYVGPAEGKSREEWSLRPSAELLDLKICDPAMGSGAFLVQVVRWLAERIVEAWDVEQPEESQVESREERVMHARRLVAERCVYGVDVNPLAVEMGKLSLWLVTLSQGRPFGFLDHALKCGDSLLGVHDLDQIRYLDPDPASARKKGPTLFDPGPLIDEAIGEAERQRIEIEAFEVMDARDAAAKGILLARSEAAVAEIRSLCDIVCILALELSKSTEAVRSAGFADAQIRLTQGSVEWEEFLVGRRGAATGSYARIFFHWAIEFPEVFQAGGFDAIVGNPPFMGSTRVSETHGDDYNAYLAYRYPPHSRRVDLCGMFFRRASELVRERGAVGMLATNTISQGETRKATLDYLLTHEWVIPRARKSFPWPGDAAVFASAVWLVRPNWSGEINLDRRLVDGIDGGLSPGAGNRSGVSRTPHQLAANKRLCFQGPTIWGERRGFFVSDSQAADFFAVDPRNREVVRRCLNGSRLNSAPDQSPDNWVIYFGERSEDEARTYAAPFHHLEQTVKTWRQSLDSSKYSRIVNGWWKYFHSRADLFEGIASRGLGRVLVRSRVSSYHMLAFLPSDIMFTDALVVFLYDDWATFAVLQSGVHEAWLRRWASSLKGDVRYQPKACFETFPLPADYSRSLNLESAGESLYCARSAAMAQRKIGLTALYKLIYDPEVLDEDVELLRRLYVQLNAAVAEAYGLDSSRLEHGHHLESGRRYFGLSKSSSHDLVDAISGLM